MSISFFDFVENINQEQLLGLLDWGTSALWEQVKVKDDPFAWINGVHYFQPISKGKITFNKRMVQVWLAAKSQRDPQMHLDAIAAFQQSFPRPVRGRGKNIA
ncbi:MAG: hypothetical protein LH679_02290 [Cyanobacteria bacterium CAN_BIN43]|nr:hypothetical protein [Cyanobacteria bacterium CAN_BIN43]